MKIDPFFSRNTQTWQITSRALINIHLGGTIFGVALMPKKEPFKPRWWTRFFPILDFSFGTFAGRNGRYIFKIRIFGHGFKLRTNGDIRKDSYDADRRGFNFIVPRRRKMA